MKIIFTGGGTAGHILPLAAIAREIRKKIPEKEAQFLYLGPQDNFAKLLLSQEGIKRQTISAGKIRRYGGMAPFVQNFIDLFFKTPIGIFQAFWKMFFFVPDLIFSKGGYGALPVTIAAWMLGIPVFLHESDTIPGFTNRIAGRFALEIFASFPHTRYFSPQKMLVTGNPFRTELLEGSPQEAIQLFGLQGNKPLVLVLGGSQGAQRINDLVLLILQEALDNFEIIHQVGEKNFAQVSREAKTLISPDKEKYYHPAPFLQETQLKHAYAAADIIVSRAGSGAIFEIAALGKPSILIPLSQAAQDHQIENAYAYANTKAAVVLEQTNLTPHFFQEKLKYLLSNSQEKESMSKAALAFAKPDAARIIAQYVLEYLAK